MKPAPPLHIQQNYFFYDPVISDYFDPIDDHDASRPPPLTKREKLDMLFDGHKIKSPLDCLMFFLRFSLFILMINKLILVTTFLIQGKLFDHVNWQNVSSAVLAMFIVFYLLATLFYIALMPLPDNKCRCHYFLISSLVLWSALELTLNQSNAFIIITNGLFLVNSSIAVFASLHLFCLSINLAVSCVSSLRTSGRAEEIV